MRSFRWLEWQLWWHLLLPYDRLAVRHRAATGVPGSDSRNYLGRWSSDGHAGLPRSDVLHTQRHDSACWLAEWGAGEHRPHPNRGKPPIRCWWSGLRDHHDGKGRQHPTDGDRRRLPPRCMHATAHLGSDQRSVSRNVCTSVGAVGRTAHRHRERPCRLPLVRRSDLLLLLPQKDSKTGRAREWGPVAGSDFCGTLRHAAERSFPFSYTAIIAGPHRSPRSHQHSPCVWGRWQSHASLSIGVGSEGSDGRREKG